MKLLGNYLNKLRLGDGSLSRTIIKETIELRIRENQITLSNYIKIKNFSLIKNTIKAMKSQEWRRYLQNISEIDNHYFTRIVNFLFFFSRSDPLFLDCRQGQFGSQARHGVPGKVGQ